MEPVKEEKLISVIGGSGFVGQRLMPLLIQRGHRVNNLDVAAPGSQIAGASYLATDVRDRAALVANLRGSDLIVNLAAVHRDDVRPLSLYDEVNVDGAKNICAAADALGIKNQIFASSVAIYGFQPGIPNEDSPAQPFNDYGRTKWEAEKVYRAWQAADAQVKRLVIVRPTVIFGPGNRGNIYNLVAQLASGLFVMVGDGTNKKSIAFVSNVAAFFSHMVEYESDRAGLYVYNYCDKDDFDMNELLSVVRGAIGKPTSSRFRLPYGLGLAMGSAADIVASLARRPLPISRIRVEKFCANTVFEADRLRQTGFSPSYNLRDALIETVKHEFPPRER